MDDEVQVVHIYFKKKGVIKFQYDFDFDKRPSEAIQYDDGGGWETSLVD